MNVSSVNELHTPPGINADGDFKATLKGLYAAGDCVAGFHTVATASSSGFLVGDSIHTFVNEAGEPVVDEAQVESQKQIALAPLAAKDGTEPMEMESAIRYICDRYVGIFRSEGKLREGMRRLGSLRRVFLPQLMAKNPHYLMRCLECRNIIDVAELHIQACLERKETRGQHIRIDYPESNPALDDLFTYQRMEEGKTVLEMRKLTPLTLPKGHKEER
jgi:succinate dehydrogenase/fumarate reductase flavoprotein subunit